MTAFAKADISFRRLTREDFGLVSQWLRAPHVAPWWREDADQPAIEKRYGPVVDARDPTEVFVIELDGQAIGMIQRYRLADDPDWERALAVAAGPSSAAGIDYLIGLEQLVGQGLGAHLIRHFTSDTWGRYPEIAGLLVSVQAENRRSWRALEKAGFRRQWSGELESDDPSDAGLSYVYVLDRPGV